MIGDTQTLAPQISDPIAGVSDPMAALLGQMQERDPALALIAKMLVARQTAAEATDAPVVRQDDEQLLSELEFVTAELRQARAQLALIAAALGACERCWGTDSTCRTCLGAGEPGSFAPDEALFADVVLPAARRYRRLPVRPTRHQHTATQGGNHV